VVAYFIVYHCTTSLNDDDDDDDDDAEAISLYLGKQTAHWMIDFTSFFIRFAAVCIIWVF